MARSISDVQEDLTAAYACRRAILLGQSYSIGSRSLTRANLTEVNDLIRELSKEESGLSGGGGGVLLPTWR